MFSYGIQCGNSENFKYALDKGLYLMEHEAKEFQLKLDKELNFQSDQKSTPIKNQQTKHTRYT